MSKSTDTAKSNETSLQWSLHPFDVLTPHELYELLQLRSQVFVLEQKCIYLDADNKDQRCFHLLGRNHDGKLVAYARIVPAGVAFAELSIGRVITCASVRRTGAGKELMQKAIATCRELYGEVDIRIGAQKYLIAFYASFGFVVDGYEYLEDDIPHIEMLRKSNVESRK